MIKKDQIETPALLVDLDILESNINKMASYFEGKSARLRPHFKSFKSPAIAHMQIKAGAKGITCAKLSEAEVLVEAGINDVLIANQIVDTSKIERLAGLAHNAKITVCVDNASNVTDISNMAEVFGSTVYILVEIEMGMMRCGVETKEEALRLARQIADSKGLVFEGFQAYAGQLCHLADLAERKKGVEKGEAKLIDFKTYFEANGMPVKEISGAGTGTYNLPHDNKTWTEIQAGSYIFMDTDYNSLDLGFENALTVLTTVIHKRRDYAVTDAGIKVCCQEKGKPAIKGYTGLSVIHLSEEHGKIHDENDELAYLQKIEYIPSHCCATANLHDYYYCVRDNLLETVWPISGRGKSR